jgi:hypothetical protein
MEKPNQEARKNKSRRDGEPKNPTVPRIQRMGEEDERKTWRQRCLKST